MKGGARRGFEHKEDPHLHEREDHAEDARGEHRGLAVADLLPVDYDIGDAADEGR